MAAAASAAARCGAKGCVEEPAAAEQEVGQRRASGKASPPPHGVAAKRRASFASAGEARRRRCATGARAGARAEASRGRRPGSRIDLAAAGCRTRDHLGLATAAAGRRSWRSRACGTSTAQVAAGPRLCGRCRRCSSDRRVGGRGKGATDDVNDITHAVRKCISMVLMMILCTCVRLRHHK